MRPVYVFGVHVNHLLASSQLTDKATCFKKKQLYKVQVYSFTMLHGLALTATHFGVWVSSLIVMGIMSYLISRSAGGVYYERNTHTIYEEVIVSSL